MLRRAFSFKLHKLYNKRRGYHNVVLLSVIDSATVNNVRHGQANCDDQLGSSLSGQKLREVCESARFSAAVSPIPSLIVNRGISED